MSKNIVTRTGKDRLRYTVMFELILIMIMVPTVSFVLERPIFSIGLLAITLSVKAMLMNFIYCWGFDRIDVRAGRVPTERRFMGRVIHAVGFETILVLTSLPIVMWWLGFTIWQALMMDVAISAFVVTYTFLFGLGYDKLFPVPQPAIPVGA